MRTPPRWITGIFSLATLLCASAAEPNSDAAKSPAGGPLYELRTYYAAPGRLEDLNARFRNHTLKIFERHGMTNVAYWVPVNNTNETLVYILAFPSREARERSWKGFGADLEWKKVAKETTARGEIVKKVESVLMTAADYSPQVPIEKAGPRVFELRTYTAQTNNFDALNARFRNHTIKLFERHGMKNIGYWTPLPGQKVPETTLIYVIAHRDAAARDASFAAFQKDPEWVAAKKASEENRGALASKVESVMLKATDYSPLQ